ncbi:MAG: hypothetical protein A2Y79_12440 [Deltaproteobacteria bacterium RBG_13_43_22]|jgi:NADH-quinone oxidoreductase subunit E|nr:MAG: hypothetical protein A2Y79_12440 [Deltaproteobacteria bacterium RBG_13_43_22]
MDQVTVQDTLKIEDRITEILEGFSIKSDGLIPMLQAVQRVWGFLPEPAFPAIARLMKISTAEIIGTATFYSQFRFQPTGKYLIRVCCGTSCHVHGSDRVLEDVQNQLVVTPGQTTKDKLFTLETVVCFGSCAMSPIMVIEDSVFGRMNRFKVQKLLTTIRMKEKGGIS